MIVARPAPFAEAIAALAARGLMPTSLSSRELDGIDAEIRERAFFSARVRNAEILDKAKTLLQRVVAPETLAPGQYMDKARFREEFGAFLGSIGYEPPEGAIGTLKDLRSDLRKELIYETNVRQAQGFGQHVQATDPVVLDAFPAQELFRLESRKEPRDWAAKWVRAGGKLVGGGRMVALKNDPIWTRSIEAGGFNRFARPYPPFDFNSGMWIRPISLGEARKWGLLAAGERVAMPQPQPLNEDLQASVKTMSPAVQRDLERSMGGRASIVEGVLKIAGDRQLVPAAKVAKQSAVSAIPDNLISSQRFIDPDTVDLKIKSGDFRVQVVTMTSPDGDEYKLIVDGHHSLEAAKRAGVEPIFEESEHNYQDDIREMGFDGFLESQWNDDDYYFVKTNRSVF